MYRVMVVDDEPLIARSISKMIPQSNAAFQVEAIAFDGESALKQIGEIRPNIVFTDIKMPIMNGLELAKQIRLQFPEIKTVIISGYDEFEYAKQAIHEGVVEYLLKPINRSSLKTLLGKLEILLDTYCYEEQAKLWNGILHRSSDQYSQENIKKWFPQEQYLVALFCCGSYCNSPAALPKSLLNFWHEHPLKEKMHSLFSCYSYWSINGYYPNEQFVLLSCCAEEEQPLEEVFKQIHQDLLSYQIPITLLIREFSGDPRQLRPVALQMHSLLSQILCFGKSFSWINAPAINQKELRNAFSSSISRNLSILYKEGRRHHFEKELDKAFTFMENSNFSQKEIEFSLKQFTFSLIRQNGLSELEGEFLPLLYDMTTRCYSYPALLEEYESILHGLFYAKNLQGKEEKNNSVSPQQIRGYINSNYTRPINVQTIAQELGVVAPYLSRLYVEHYGISIKNEILLRRIEKAKELLSSTPFLSLREIADLTGFNDQFYFSKVFKQQTGKSPAEYRKMVMKSNIDNGQEESS